MIPAFDQFGNLPEGVYRLTQQVLINHFGSSSPRRKWLAKRLEELLELIKTTGKVDRVFVWGSFVTAKDSPNDLDIFILVSNDFTEQTQDSFPMLFDHNQAKMRFCADIFWARGAIGEDTIELWLDTYQNTRGMKRRGIVEVML